MSWNLRDMDGKFRSRKAYKQDAAQDSQQPWELARKKKNDRKKNNNGFFGDGFGLDFDFNIKW